MVLVYIQKHQTFASNDNMHIESSKLAFPNSLPPGKSDVDQVGFLQQLSSVQRD